VKSRSEKAEEGEGQVTLERNELDLGPFVQDKSFKPKEESSGQTTRSELGPNMGFNDAKGLDSIA
jgi:hypothetical protein